MHSVLGTSLLVVGLIAVAFSITTTLRRNNRSIRDAFDELRVTLWPPLSAFKDSNEPEFEQAVWRAKVVAAVVFVGLMTYGGIRYGFGSADHYWP